VALCLSPFQKAASGVLENSRFHYIMAFIMSYIPQVSCSRCSRPPDPQSVYGTLCQIGRSNFQAVSGILFCVVLLLILWHPHVCASYPFTSLELRSSAPRPPIPHSAYRRNPFFPRADFNPLLQKEEEEGVLLPNGHFALRQKPPFHKPPFVFIPSFALIPVLPETPFHKNPFCSAGHFRPASRPLPLFLARCLAWHAYRMCTACPPGCFPSCPCFLLSLMPCVPREAIFPVSNRVVPLTCFFCVYRLPTSVASRRPDPGPS
jgi:hypothetical protein